MTLHSDLLAQAEHLATKEPRRPKQASLRRAISNAYYALFHLLILDASRVFVKDRRLLNRLNRVYGHGKMKEVSLSFAEGKWPRAFDPLKEDLQIPQELKSVARAFTDLQEARHDADYNLAKTFSRDEALALVDLTEQAFRDWEKIRKDDIARLYLSCFLLWDTWNKGR